MAEFSIHNTTLQPPTKGSPPKPKGTPLNPARIPTARLVAEAIEAYIRRPQSWRTYGECPSVDELTKVIEEAMK